MQLEGSTFERSLPQKPAVSNFLPCQTLRTLGRKKDETPGAAFEAKTGGVRVPCSRESTWTSYLDFPQSYLFCKGLMSRPMFYTLTSGQSSPSISGVLSECDLSLDTDPFSYLLRFGRTWHPGPSSHLHRTEVRFGGRYENGGL